MTDSRTSHRRVFRSGRGRSPRNPVLGELRKARAVLPSGLSSATRRRRGLALLTGVALACGVSGASAGDRLERFATLGREGLEAAAVADGAERERAVSELYELVDAEVLDNLRSGGPFAASAFIQERLDALVESWGGATLRLVRVGGTAGRPSLIVGAYSVAGIEESGSLRVYGGAGREAALVALSTHDGVPEVQAWPPRRDGVLQFAGIWTGAPSGGPVRALRVELWQASAGGRVARLWSSADLWPAGLWASAWRLTPGQLVVRYELRYPGWKPGCAGQTVQEDTYRQSSSAALALARRRVLDGWHRELGAAADRLFQALRSGQSSALGELVPDRALRGRLPRTLAAEPACDLQSPAAPGTVVVAATEKREGRQIPWALHWSRGPRGWRLIGASPVLE